MMDINMWAVLICGLFSMILGSVWYGPVFGKYWMEYQKMTPEKVKEFPKSRMAKYYALAFVGSLVTAYVMANVISFAGATTWFAGLQGGFWMWLGFAVPVLLGGVLWESKPLKAFWINVSYYLILLAVFGALLASWR